MRFLSARSSGRSGIWLTDRLPGAQLLAGAEAHLRAGPRPDLEEFGSTKDLLVRMERWIKTNPTGVIVHAAAVGDYAVEDPSGKIPSGQPELVLRLRPTPKILDRIHGWAPEARIVSFKAAPPETERDELVRLAEAQRVRTHSDIVFANVLEALDRVAIVDARGAEHFHERGPALEALLTRIRALRED
jgi:phosphopantothenoylcysteine decarboxylase/phosphopantothenate--cysteine ligase